MEYPINVAVIGVGAFGQNHARITSQLDGIHLIGVVDPDIARSKEIAEKLHTKSIEKYQDVVKQAEAVIIVTPTSFHYEVGSFFLSHGVNVFIEKPIASNSLEADKLVKIAKQKNLTLKVGHIERFNPAFLSVRQLIRKPLFIEARRTSPFPERIKDTDVIMDMMIHDIDLTLDLASSNVKDVKAFGMKVLSDRTDMAQALIEFENGIVANITVSRVSPSKFRKIRVFEKDRYFSVDLLNKNSYIAEVENINSKKVLKTSSPEMIEIDSLQSEIQDFLVACRGEKSRGVDGEAAASALKLAEKIVSEIRCP